MIHVEPELPREIAGLTTAPLLACLELGLEHDADGRLVAVDVEAGEVIPDHASFRAWLAEHPERIEAAVDWTLASKPRLMGQTGLFDMLETEGWR